MCRYQPTTCVSPVCNNDPTICPGSIVCPPEDNATIALIELACISLFTIEFTIRFFTVWAANSRFVSSIAHIYTLIHQLNLINLNIYHA